MKKTVKIITILLIVLTIIMATTNVFAAEVTVDQLKPDYSADVSGLTSKVSKIIGTIRNIALIVAVIVIMIIGVKYMLGSVEEKAEYKKTFMPLIIGIILVVAATTIASFLFSIVG